MTQGFKWRCESVSGLRQKRLPVAAHSAAEAAGGEEEVFEVENRNVYIFINVWTLGQRQMTLKED